MRLVTWSVTWHFCVVHGVSLKYQHCRQYMKRTAEYGIFGPNFLVLLQRKASFSRLSHDVVLSLLQQMVHGKKSCAETVYASELVKSGVYF